MPPEIIFDQKPGEIFVVRSIDVDQGAIASVEYAITHFGIRYLMVLGHTADSNKDGWEDPQAMFEKLKGSPLLAQTIEKHQLAAEPAIYNLNTGTVTDAGAKTGN